MRQQLPCEQHRWCVEVVYGHHSYSRQHMLDPSGSHEVHQEGIRLLLCGLTEHQHMPGSLKVTGPDCTHSTYHSTCRHSTNTESDGVSLHAQAASNDSPAAHWQVVDGLLAQGAIRCNDEQTTAQTHKRGRWLQYHPSGTGLSTEQCASSFSTAHTALLGHKLPTCPTPCNPSPQTHSPTTHPPLPNALTPLSTKLLTAVPRQHLAPPQ
jgi:hypothetical protein